MPRRGKIVLFLLAMSIFITAICSYATGKKSLAIFNFRPTNIEAMEYSGEILYGLISMLGMEDSVDLMPRRTMEEVLFQAGLVQSDNPNIALKAGKVLGTNFVLFGHVTKKGSGIVSDIYLMDIQKGLSVKSWSFTLSGREGIKDWVPGFTKELIDTMSQREGSASTSASVVENNVGIENFRALNKGNKVLLSWKFDSSKPISAFNIYRSENKEGPYQLLTRVNKSMYEDASMKAGRDYYYRIGIVFRSGKEVQNQEIAEALNVGEKNPYPPLIISGEGHVRRTLITFVPSLQNDQENFMITGYEVYRGESDKENWLKIMTVDPSKRASRRPFFEIEDTKEMLDGVNFLYAVSSVDAKDRKSPLSDPFSVKTIDRPVLEIKGDNLLRKVVFSWSALENVKGYKLYRKSGTEEYQQIATILGTNITGYTDQKDLEDGKIYRYYLTGFDQKRETGGSPEVETKTKELPSFPDGIRAENGSVKSVLIYWTPIQDPDVGGYIIYRGESEDEFKQIARIKGHESSSYQDKGSGYKLLNDGKEYFYKVSSYNLFNAEGLPSNPIKAQTKSRPLAVVGLTVTAEPESVHVNWQKNHEIDIAQYILYRNYNDDGRWSKIQSLEPTQTDYHDNDLKSGVVYRYKIVAVDKDNLESDPVESEAIVSPLVDKK